MPIKRRSILMLCCSCCGGAAPALEQWYNRDKGYGLCPKCAIWNKGKESEEYMRSCYGKEGTHYFTTMPGDDDPGKAEDDGLQGKGIAPVSSHPVGLIKRSNDDLLREIWDIYTRCCLLRTCRAMVRLHQLQYGTRRGI